MVRASDASAATPLTCVATLNGTTNPELLYVISSHYDSVAADRAQTIQSGTAALLEAARLLADHPLAADDRVRVVDGRRIRTAGEPGVRPARVREQAKVVGALNNDMVGWANDQRLDNTIRYSNPDLRDIHMAPRCSSRI